MLELLAALMLNPAGPPPEDAPARTPRTAALQSCVDTEFGAGRDGSACIGRLSGPCQDAEGGSTTPGMIACLAAEEADWRELMDAALARAAADQDLEPDARRALARSQAGWRQSMERSLAVYDGRDGTIWPVIKTGVRADWTARRYFWVRSLIEP